MLSQLLALAGFRFLTAFMQSPDGVLHMPKVIMQNPTTGRYVQIHDWPGGLPARNVGVTIDPASHSGKKGQNIVNIPFPTGEGATAEYERLQADARAKGYVVVQGDTSSGTSNGANRRKAGEFTFAAVKPADKAK